MLSPLELGSSLIQEVFSIDQTRYDGATSLIPQARAALYGGGPWTPQSSVVHDQHLIHRSFSAARMTTYEGAVARAQLRAHPFELYRWNMRVSGAFLLPLHTCEVVTRNAVAEAVAQQHGAL